ncbi:MbnP family copper-binding protein [Sorangium sp. So ce513]|uniref:MbnP family copper-binding protein n=1 Tax=Sorangium sp. So ce513 TaxID=3133315 RepID=UPI003F6419A4
MKSNLRGSRLLLPLIGAALSLMACGGEGGTSPVDAATTSTGTGGTGGGGDGAGGGDGGAGEGGAGGDDGTIPVELKFEGRVGNDVFSCEGSYAVGTSQTEVRLNDFRVYLHDVRLRRADGELVPVTLDQDGLWQHQDVVLLDFEDRSGSCANGTRETNSVVRGVVPAGDYDGLSFKVGVPPELNHGDASTAPSPLNLSGLWWNWTNGYKFLRIDSTTEADQGAFLVHVGSTSCANGADGKVTCDRPNIAEVTFEDIDPLATTVVADYAALVLNSDVGASAGAHGGCMSEPDNADCALVFTQLGIDIADGSPRPEHQAFFRVE